MSWAAAEMLVKEELEVESGTRRARNWAREQAAAFAQPQSPASPTLHTPAPAPAPSRPPQSPALCIGYRGV